LVTFLLVLLNNCGHLEISILTEMCSSFREP